MKNKEILIEDAIRFHEEQVKVCSEKMTRALFGEERCDELKAEHIQRAKWLRELQEYKAQPEIVRCGECERSEVGGCELYCMEWMRYTSYDGYCHRGIKRRTDGSI